MLTIMSEDAAKDSPPEPKQKPKPKIAITMGDPAGIGPEICLIALQNPDILNVCTPLVFGDAGVLVRCADEVMLEPPEHIIPLNEWSANHELFEKPAIIDVGAMEQHEIDHVHAGMSDEASGRASYTYITTAIKAALDGQVQGIATAPINKEALRSAGVQYPGHTEIFAEKFKAERSCMMLTSKPLTCSFVTVHVGYAEVPGLLSVERILEVIELTYEALKKGKGIEQPKLVVCGLNPHAGEGGLFGNKEEEEFIIPAIEQARAKGIEHIEGPLPPDTAFLEPKRKQTDAFICMYHDQGHIPLKALAFDEAINTTLGLSIPRTSVDHGTALDIAWQGKANPNSLFEAITLAAKLAEQDRESEKEETADVEDA
jgi:4-hydroxythreonine-4-phosphate dehydrogenase